MKIPGYKRIFKGDFPPDQQSLVEKLSFIINDGFQTLYEQLNKKLTFKDNMMSTIRSFTVSVDANGIPRSTTQFNIDETTKIEGLLVIRVENVDNSFAYPSGAVQIDAFRQEDRLLTVDHITGLDARVNYRIKLLTIS